ncbi:MAG: Sec-independent protein translocase subunit TatB [Arcobacteraceae bacterium]|nr:Sec-independent protein translocase subunit TatB [Arcobacteraceae bacterium]
MFGMGFMEIFLVLIVGIIALGPEKLPSALVDIAKFFKKFKSGIDEAKATIDSELKISEMKQQAEEFKASVGDVTNLAKIDLESINSDKLIDDTEDKKPVVKKEKKTKKAKISLSSEEV